MKTLTEVYEGLQQPIPGEAIHAPDSSAGIFGEYVPAQWAMQEANNIFGVDGIMGFDVLNDQSIEIPIPEYPFGNWVFITTVKVTFRVLDEHLGIPLRFSRIGRGVGTAFAPFNRDTGEMAPVKPQQLDTAAKAALSDAIKNALMRTGQRLGAELYFDERMAQVLGWEVATDRVTRQGSSGENDLESLGAVVCKYGIGKADDDGVKPYTGWTIQQMWDDPDGRGVFDWAVEREATGWLPERLRKFAALQAKEPGGEPDADKRMITIWTGGTKPAEGKPVWPNLSANEQFVAMLTEAFDPEGKIKDFNPNHRRMTNHYKFHFGVTKGSDLTWEMLNALVSRCKEGEEAVAFGYPQFYGSDTEIEDTSDEPDSSSVHDTPAFILGEGKKTQQVPVGLQPVAKDAGIDDPKVWLWETMMDKEPVGEWTSAHTDLVLRIIDTVTKTEGLEYDSPVVGQMWEFGADGIANQ